MNEDEIARAHKRALMDLSPQNLAKFNHHPKTEGKSLPFFLGLEGGGDWQIVEQVASWICPKGLYRVFVSPQSDEAIILNGKTQAIGYITAAGWLPAFSIVISDGAGGVMMGSFVACEEGWLLSSGDVLSITAGVMDVRFRRVG